MSITVEGFEGMISGSLGITEPWYIKECRVDSKTQTMHIYVSYEKMQNLRVQNAAEVLRDTDTKRMNEYGSTEMCFSCTHVTCIVGVRKYSVHAAEFSK